jgi:hypothetical protein
VTLTKDGHIPTAGMFVTGKGPMTGKIVSVSKDKTKATVLTTDGKKTTRLISALKTDASANYSAYAAPVTAKDIPQGMPLAVDTIAEALAEDRGKDGKFRAILTAHPGVSRRPDGRHEDHRAVGQDLQPGAPDPDPRPARAAGRHALRAGREGRLGQVLQDVRPGGHRGQAADAEVLHGQPGRHAALEGGPLDARRRTRSRPSPTIPAAPASRSSR